MILAYCWGKSERRSRSTIPPSQIPFVWGEPIGSRPWSDLVFSSLFFLSYSPISISCFVGIWERRIWALLVFLPFAFGASVWVLGEDSVGWKVRSFLLLGSWNPRRFGDFVGLWTCWEPPIKLWRLPQSLCKGFGCHLRRPPLSGAWGHLHRCAHGRIGWAGFGVLGTRVWSQHLSKQRRTSLYKEGTSGIISSCLPCGISIPEPFTYALYFVIAIVLEVIYILLSHSWLSCLA